MSNLRHRLRTCLATTAASAVVLGLAATPAVAAPADPTTGRLQIEVSVGAGLLDAPTDGRVMVLFAPATEQPLNNTEVDGPNKTYGLNVSDVVDGQTITLAGGSAEHADTEVYGYPLVSLDELPAGTYRAQAFLTRYETVTRSDGSTVTLRLPCGDGGLRVGAPGSLIGDPVAVTITGQAQTVALALDSEVPPVETAGQEIGGCAQGDYADTPTFKHIKIRSEALSSFWGRDVYVGANVALPAGYDPTDPTTRYPVVYSQGHWPGGGGAFGYPDWTDFAQQWDSGARTTDDGAGTQPIAPMILVTIRQEAPYYDDAYGVNSANLGPWGDAINDELVPYIDSTFNTIAAPYGRIQEGGSTGGWISLASTIFRPDLYGAAFSYYPDSLDFDAHQDIDLYSEGNAYVRPDGSAIGSIRRFENGQEVVLTTTAEENHWELAFGTSSRSFGQWDIWNAVFGIQGVNGYPLEPWNKVTGEIYPEAVQAWRPMDLSDYVASNWTSTRDLGTALDGRLHISVGAEDNYYLNGGVERFRDTVQALGGPGWADVQVIPGLGHGGFYGNTSVWQQLDVMAQWVTDHAPDGATPLDPAATAPTTRGNDFADVIAHGGHAAALARQSAPSIVPAGPVTPGTTVQATTGTWDPGVELTAGWVLDGGQVGSEIPVEQGQTLRSPVGAPSGSTLTLQVTGTKLGYPTETRSVDVTTVSGGGSPPTTPGATPSSTPGATGPAATPPTGGVLAWTSGTPERGTLVAMTVGAILLVVLGAGALLLGRRRRTR